MILLLTASVNSVMLVGHGSYFPFRRNEIKTGALRENVMCSSRMWTFKLWDQTRYNLKELYQNHVVYGYGALTTKSFILQIYSCYATVLTNVDVT